MTYICTASGRRRKAEQVKCEFCGTDFLSPTAPSQRCKFCSLSCATKSRLHQISLVCAGCSTTFVRPASYLRAKSKSGLRFCSKACKGQAQRLGGIEAIMPAHYGTSKERYRSEFSDSELVCKRCGYHEFTCSVEVHHKDGDHDNEQKSNLVPLCANCHRGLHNGLWDAGML